MFQFLHAADLHLDTQPTGLHGYPDEVAVDAPLPAFDHLAPASLSDSRFSRQRCRSCSE